MEKIGSHYPYIIFLPLVFKEINKHERLEAWYLPLYGESAKSEREKDHKESYKSGIQREPPLYDEQLSLLKLLPFFFFFFEGKKASEAFFFVSLSTPHFLLAWLNGEYIPRVKINKSREYIYCGISISASLPWFKTIFFS